MPMVWPSSTTYQHSTTQHGTAWCCIAQCIQSTARLELMEPEHRPHTTSKGQLANAVTRLKPQTLHCCSDRGSTSTPTLHQRHSSTPLPSHSHYHRQTQRPVTPKTTLHVHPQATLHHPLYLACDLARQSSLCQPCVPTCESPMPLPITHTVLQPDHLLTPCPEPNLQPRPSPCSDQSL